VSLVRRLGSASSESASRLTASAIKRLNDHFVVIHPPKKFPISDVTVL